MLPEKLSTDLTSLGEGQDRLSLVIQMVVAADGSQNDIVLVGAVQQLENVSRSFFNALVVQFSQVHRWNEDDCVALLLNLEDSSCRCQRCLCHSRLQ